MEIITERKRRSEKLTKPEHKAFLNYVQSFDTKVDALQALGISRPTLDAVIFRGSGKPETVKIIREKLSGWSSRGKS